MFKHALSGVLMLLVMALTGCGAGGSGSGGGTTDVTVNVGSTSLASMETAPLFQLAEERSAAEWLLDTLISKAHAAFGSYPFIDRVTLSITGEGITTADINANYNSSRFVLDAAGNIEIDSASFTITVPNDIPLTFVITAYNTSGYQMFTGTGTLSPKQLVATTVTLPIRLKVDIDPSLPRRNSVSGCVDSDSDDFCDIYEDMFVNSSGIPDVDGDGVINSLDTDADGDSVDPANSPMTDDVEGDFPSYDGYPLFISKNVAPASVSLTMSTNQGTAVQGVPMVSDNPGDCFSFDIPVGPDQEIEGMAEIVEVVNRLAGGNPACTYYEVVFTPVAGFFGDVSFDIVVKDMGGLTATGQANVNVVAGPNTAPYINGSVSANGESSHPSINQDGTVVAFESYSDNLVEHDMNYYTDVYMWEASTNTVKLVSQTSGGFSGYGSSYSADVSASGDYVVFVSDAGDLITSDMNYYPDVFIRDIPGNTVMRVTENGAGDVYGYPETPTVSDVGPTVAFTYESITASSNPLISGYDNIYADVFVKDMGSSVIELITYGDIEVPSTNGNSMDPVICNDPKFVVYQSYATNIPAINPDTNGSTYGDVFWHDREGPSGPEPRIVSVKDADGTQINNSAYTPRVSGSGRYVAFTTHATDVVAADTDSLRDVYVRDTLDLTTTLVSVNNIGAKGNSQSYAVDINATGDVIVFESYSNNLVLDTVAGTYTADTNSVADIFVYDRTDAANIVVKRVSVSSDGTEANGGSYNPRVSDDGRFVVFESDATNLVPNDDNDIRDIFLHNIETGETKRVSQKNGLPSIMRSDYDTYDDVIDLKLFFTDDESGSNGLTYSVVDNTNPAIFSAVVMDGAGVLTLSYPGGTVGSAEITVRATDGQGAYVDGIIKVNVQGYAMLG